LFQETDEENCNENYVDSVNMLSIFRKFVFFCFFLLARNVQSNCGGNILIIFLELFSGACGVCWWVIEGGFFGENFGKMEGRN
jgi:hypothetical protein